MIVGLVPEHLKASPNTKMFLRSFWYRATLKQVVTADEMHIYTLARWVLRSAGRLAGMCRACVYAGAPAAIASLPAVRWPQLVSWLLPAA